MNQDALLHNALISKFRDYPAKVIRLEVSKILGISNMSVYNKLAGRSEFTLKEYVKLAQELDISIDALIFNKKIKSIRFHSDAVGNPIESFEDYLINTYDNIKLNLNSPIQKITHISAQPHILNFLRFPHLLYLKLFSYNLINWQCESVKAYDPVSFINKKESVSVINKLKRIIDHTPQKQILNQNYLYKTALQIKQLFNAGYIVDDYHKKKVINELYDFVDDFKQRLKNGGIVSEEGTFIPNKVYINNFIQVGDIILYEAELSSLVAILCDAPNVIGTNNSHYIDHMIKYLEKVQDFSIKISKGGGAFRKQFFDNIDASLAEVKNLI